MNNIPNFKDMSSIDGKVYGKFNTLKSINPYNCKFLATYPDGKVVHGNNLFDTGWNEIPNGLCNLKYILSTGHLIDIPKYKAYKPLIECSVGMDGSRVFHAILVNCLGTNRIITYKIILKEDKDSKFKIGDIIIKETPLCNKIDKFWKFTDY